MKPYSNIIFARLVPELSEGKTVDVYRLAAEIHKDLPEVEESEIRRMIETEIVQVRCSALWDPDHKRAPEAPSHD